MASGIDTFQFRVIMANLIKFIADFFIFLLIVFLYSIYLIVGKIKLNGILLKTCNFLLFCYSISFLLVLIFIFFSSVLKW